MLSTSVSITESLSENLSASSRKYNEVYTIINKLKSNRADGTGNIPPELIKNEGRTLK
jgi:hypothetical protein